MGINCDGEVLFAEKSTVQLTRWLDSTDQPFLTFAFDARRPAADRSSMTTCVYMATNNLTRVHLYNICIYYVRTRIYRPRHIGRRILVGISREYVRGQTGTRSLISSVEQLSARPGRPLSDTVEFPDPLYGKFYHFIPLSFITFYPTAAVTERTILCTRHAVVDPCKTY